jgi:quercetin dioxygenase-like cupin family protein
MQKLYLIIAISFSSLLTNAQPAVRNEPRHHNVFENDYVRILDVFIPPHDTTQFHIHNTPSIFIMLTKTAIGSQLMGRQPTKDVSVAGSYWYDSLVTPRIHRVWNDDSTWFHPMDIELIAGKPHSDQAVLQNPFLQLSFNEPLVNGYHVQLQTGKTIELAATVTGYLLVSTGDATIEYKVDDHIQHRIMKSGHYLWIDPGKPFAITSDGNTPADFLLLQLK